MPFSRPSGTSIRGNLWVLTLKRWALLACPFGTKTCPFFVRELIGLFVTVMSLVRFTSVLVCSGYVRIFLSSSLLCHVQDGVSIWSTTETSRAEASKAFWYF